MSCRIKVKRPSRDEALAEHRRAAAAYVRFASRAEARGDRRVADSFRDLALMRRRRIEELER